MLLHQIQHVRRRVVQLTSLDADDEHPRTALRNPVPSGVDEKGARIVTQLVILIHLLKDVNARGQV